MAGVKTNGIHHVAIRAADFDKSVAFYSKALGFVEVRRWGEGDGRAIMLDTGNGSCVEIFAGGQGPKPDGNLLHFAIRCDDPDAALARAVAGGATATVLPKSVVVPAKPANLEARLAFCTGPDGETIEFFRGNG